jgi:lipopolysaccharide transport system permease protein
MAGAVISLGFSPPPSFNDTNANQDKNFMNTAHETTVPSDQLARHTTDLPDGEVDASSVELVIRARTGWIAVDWAELIRFRELLFFLIWRDVKIRYKQTVLGVAWAILQPLFTMVIFTVIFGRFAGIPSEGQPYALFVFAGLLPWTFFANGVAASGMSLVSQQQLLTKIYFPRLFVPTASAGAFLIDLAINLGLFGVILLFYGVMPSWQVVFLPLLLLLTVLATLGFGFTLAALTVLYRDFRYVIPFMIQILMYVSPVIFPITMLPERYRMVLALNPMCGIIEAFRSAILGTPWNLGSLAISTASTLALLVFGLFYFRKTERRFADIA